MAGYPDFMTRITQCDLSRNADEVLRRVAAGEAFEVADRGVVIAYLSPVSTQARPFLGSRPARRTGGWSELPKVILDRQVSNILDSERQDRLLEAPVTRTV